MTVSLPHVLRHTDGRTYKILRADPFDADVWKDGKWIPLRGNVNKMREIRRAFQRLAPNSK